MSLAQVCHPVRSHWRSSALGNPVRVSAYLRCPMAARDDAEGRPIPDPGADPGSLAPEAQPLGRKGIALDRGEGEPG